ncbi:TIR domain-containing protein [Dactylosporangium sp. NPDC049525]|uniref:toll/interleukin-1 receptor domain-containing protein n=1 Tax=Dactylosporangium sp. NPDC049525 TaxID=3154730 RepID=UPI00341668DA
MAARKDTGKGGYDAFISYSRADRALAVAIYNGLRRLARPPFAWQALKVFRDETDLGVNPALFTTIAGALDRSARLVVIASPAAAASEWVNREIQHFRDGTPGREILLVLADGTFVWSEEDREIDFAASTAAPAALRGCFAEEPTYLDAAPLRAGGSLALDDGAFRRFLSRLAAPMHGLAPYELEDDDRRLQRRALRRARAAIAALVVLTVLAVGTGVLAVRNADRAQAQSVRAASRALALQAVGKLGSDLDLAMLLAVQASRMEDSFTSRQALLRTLQYAPLATSVQVWAVDPLAMAVSPDGTAVASFGRDGIVQVRPARAGRIGAVRAGKSLPGTQRLAFLDNDTVVAATPSGAVTTWHLTDDSTRTWQIPSTVDEGVALSRDGRLVAAAGRDGVTVWDYANGRKVGAAIPAVTNAERIAFSADGTRLAAVYPMDKALVGTVWTIADGSRSTPVNIDTEPTGKVGFDADLRRVVVDVAPFPGQSIERAAVVDLTTGKSTPLPGSVQGSSLAPLAVRADGKVAAAGDASGNITVWNLDTGASLGRLEGHANMLRTMAWIPGVNLLVSADISGRVVVSDLDLRPGLGLAPLGDPRLVLDGFGHVTAARVSRDGRGTVVDNEAGIVTLVGPDGTRTKLSGPQSFPPPIFDDPNGAAFVDGSRAVVASGPGGRLVLYPLEPAGGAPVVLSEDRGGTVALFPGGDRFLTGSPTGVITDWRRTGDRWSGTPIGELGAGPVSALAVAPDGRHVAVGARDGRVEIWDLVTGARIRAPDGPPVSSVDASPVVAWHPTEPVVAIGSDGGTVQLWNYERQRDVLPALFLGTGSVLAVDFSPDGRMLAAGGGFGTAPTLWDVAAGELLGRLGGHGSDAVTAIAFGPDGRSLVTADDDGAVLFWNVSIADWRQRLCAVAGRDLTAVEWAAYVGDVTPRRAVCP